MDTTDKEEFLIDNSTLNDHVEDLKSRLESQTQKEVSDLISYRTSQTVLFFFIYAFIICVIFHTFLFPFEFSRIRKGNETKKKERKCLRR